MFKYRPRSRIAALIPQFASMGAKLDKKDYNHRKQKQHTDFLKEKKQKLKDLRYQWETTTVYVAVYFRAIFMYTPIFLCFQELKGPKNTKISAYNFWKVSKVNFWPL